MTDTIKESGGSLRMKSGLGSVIKTTVPTAQGSAGLLELLGECVRLLAIAGESEKARETVEEKIKAVADWREASARAHGVVV